MLLSFFMYVDLVYENMNDALENVELYRQSASSAGVLLNVLARATSKNSLRLIGSLEIIDHQESQQLGVNLLKAKIPDHEPLITLCLSSSSTLLFCSSVSFLNKLTDCVAGVRSYEGSIFVGEILLLFWLVFLIIKVMSFESRGCMVQVAGLARFRRVS